MLNVKRKPRDKPTNRLPSTRQKHADASHTKPPRTSRENLTLADWLSVYAYVDAHPDTSQTRVVEHFRTRQEGALIFTQSTLCRKLRARPKMEARVNDHPSALSSKRPRIVTRPDVERALVLWVQDMKQRGEVVSGPMLREKRRGFEDKFEVPEAERLSGESWIPSFCRTYRIRESCRRGEAASSDADAAEVEPLQCQQLLANYAPDPPAILDELIYPPEHTDIGELDLCPTGKRSEDEIVDVVHREIAVAKGEVIEIDSDSEEEGSDDEGPHITRTEAMAVCAKLESVVLVYGGDLELLRLLRRFRGHLRRQELASAKQTTLDKYVVPSTRTSTSAEPTT